MITINELEAELLELKTLADKYDLTLTDVATVKAEMLKERIYKSKKRTEHLRRYSQQEQET